MPAAATATEPAADKVEDAAAALLSGNPSDEMPTVDLQAVAAEQAKEKTADSAERQQNPTPSPAPSPAPAAAPQPTSQPVLVDGEGRTFDPLLHETEDGKTPLLRADGKTIKCRRVPLKEFKTTSKVQIDQPAPAAADPAPAIPAPAPMDPEKEKMLREASAKMCAGIQLLVMRKGLGEHIGQQESDQTALVECWDEIFTYYGMGRMHPIVGLAAVTGMITFDGMKQAETRNALTRALLWCKVKIGSLWLWMHRRREQQ